MAESITRPARSVTSPFPLTTVFFGLVAAHRPACRQERTFHRASGLAVGWLLALGRHTVTRVLAALGLVEVDWTAFYRLFAHDRIDYDTLSGELVRRTLDLAPAEEPYLITVDGTVIPAAAGRCRGLAGCGRQGPLRSGGDWRAANGSSISAGCPGRWRATAGRCRCAGHRPSRRRRCRPRGTRPGGSGKRA